MKVYISSMTGGSPLVLQGSYISFNIVPVWIAFHATFQLFNIGQIGFYMKVEKDVGLKWKSHKCYFFYFDTWKPAYINTQAWSGEQVTGKLLIFRKRYNIQDLYCQYTQL